MIKTLQKKFIITSMTAIGILLLTLSVIINVINAVSSYKQDERILDMLCEKEFSALWQLPPEFGGYDISSGFLQPPVNENTRRSSVYFIAYADRYGKILFIDTGSAPEITTKKAVAISEEAVESGMSSGKIGEFRFKAITTEDNIGTAYVFLDISQGKSSVIRILFISFAVAALLFGLMIPVTSVLSKKAIRPIAENMEKQKNFITDAGHEIKTPLAIIMANTEALELHTGENKWTHNIKEQSNRLDALTKELLSLAKLDKANVKLIQETVSVSAIVQDTILMFYENAAHKRVLINENIAQDILMKADKEHIVRLVSVLVDNAVKYCSPGSIIDISLLRYEKKIVLTVRNVCDRLPECDSEKLFDRFFRGDSSRNQSGGYGIGLSAARAITEFYNGKISAEYIGENLIEFKVIL